MKPSYWLLEPQYTKLILITQGGHGGDTIKNMKEFSPIAYQEMMKKLSEDNTIGRVFEIPRYMFVIYKKNFQTRDKEALFVAAKNSINKYLEDNSKVDIRFIMADHIVDYMKEFWPHKAYKTSEFYSDVISIKE